MRGMRKKRTLIMLFAFWAVVLMITGRQQIRTNAEEYGSMDGYLYDEVKEFNETYYLMKDENGDDAIGYWTGKWVLSDRSTDNHYYYEPNSYGRVLVNTGNQWGYGWNGYVINMKSSNPSVIRAIWGDMLSDEEQGYGLDYILYVYEPGVTVIDSVWDYYYRQTDTCKVLEYSNPCSKFAIGTKNYASAFSSYNQTSITPFSNQKIQIQANADWNLVAIRKYLNDEDYASGETITNGSTVSLEQNYQISAVFQNKKNGAYINVILIANLIESEPETEKPSEPPVTRPKYTIKFNANGGAKVTSKMYVEKGSPIAGMPITARKGYTFQGWYTKKSKGTLIKEGSICKFTKNTTLYAQWKKATYKITYNTNGGKIKGSAKKSYTISTKTFKLPTATRSGYTFKGWSSSPNKLSKVTKVKKGSAGNKTFYAFWEKKKEKTYTVTLNTNYNAQLAKSKFKLRYGQRYGNILPNTISRKGYRFEGWYTAKKGGKRVTENTVFTKKKNIKLYAHWILEKYSISYNLDGGKLKGSAKTSYNVKTRTFKLPKATKAGYTFLGWSTSSNTYNYVKKVPKGSAGHKVFYAKWARALR